MSRSKRQDDRDPLDRIAQQEHHAHTDSPLLQGGADLGEGAGVEAGVAGGDVAGEQGSRPAEQPLEIVVVALGALDEPPSATGPWFPQQGEFPPCP